MNYQYLIGAVSSGLLLVSEALPFVNIPANGIVHTVLTMFSKKKANTEPTEQVKTETSTVNVYVTCDCKK